MNKLILLLFVIPTLAIFGCSTLRESYPGHSAGVVWTAMVTAAESPNYDHEDPTERWTVRTNDTWVDQDYSRIEIYRELERRLHRPNAKPLHEKRSWTFQIALESDEPPTIRFTARNLSVPAHVWIEAERYFGDVWDILGGKPEPIVEELITRTEQSFIAEVGCAACIYNMPGYTGCSHLAVVMGGKPHVVRGVEFTAEMEPLCIKADSAALVGHMDGEEFVATGFQWSEK